MSAKQGRQNRPLNEKLSQEQLAVRADRIMRRQGIAMMRGMLVQVLQLLNRGFWGRMRWLLLGR